MQQREQLILKKLAEARRAQANAMARFIQARTRVTQVEARLQAVRARLADSSTPAAQPPEIGLPPPNPPAPPASQPASAGNTSTSAPEAMPARPDMETPLPLTLRQISEMPTTLLTPEQPASTQPDSAEDDEDTRKQPAISLPLRPAQPVPQARQKPEEETLLANFPEFVKTREADQAADKRQEASEAQRNGEASGATDITTKLPVIRQKRRSSRESS